MSAERQIEVLRADIERLMALVNENETKRIAELAQLERKASVEIGVLKEENSKFQQRSGRDSKKYNDQVAKNFTPEKFSSGKGELATWKKSIATLLDSHGFSYALECLDWAAKQKTEISLEMYNMHAIDAMWTDDIEEEHIVLNKCLRKYLDLYTKGEAGNLVESVVGDGDIKKRNGMEAWRKLIERFDPKTASQAMQIQRQAMKIRVAKSNDDIWVKIQELERLERLFIENHSDRKSFDVMTKTCIIHQILPENISQQI